MYISWAAFYEGESDRGYFGVLLPRIIDDLVLKYGTRNVTIPSDPAIVFGDHGRQRENIVREICEWKDTFHILFIHADTGGAGLERSLAERSCSYCAAVFEECGYQIERCVVITPKHETEAWALADPAAVSEALGVRNDTLRLDIPSDARAAERDPDPKRTLNLALERNRRSHNTGRSSRILPIIAQIQSLDALRRSESFSRFEERLRSALAGLGCVTARN